MKYNFSELFTENPDGSLTPKRLIYVNGVTFGPGVALGQGISFSGIDFQQYKNLPIEGEETKEGVLIIRGFYRN